jgi:hypothetical protein
MEHKKAAWRRLFLPEPWGQLNGDGKGGVVA